MLWEMPDGCLELANVGPKFELHIAEGEPGAIFAAD
jgi:hypothetical protein